MQFDGLHSTFSSLVPICRKNGKRSQGKKENRRGVYERVDMTRQRNREEEVTKIKQNDEDRKRKGEQENTASNERDDKGAPGATS